MKRRELVILMAIWCIAGVARAETQPSTDQAAFEALFRSWQKGAKRSTPAKAGQTSRRSLSTSGGVARTVITSPMGMRVNPVTGDRRLHAGADLAAPLGAMVRATADGVVMRAGSTGGYGLLVTVRHPGGYETRYAHMSRILVVPGQQIRKGALVGRVGSTGRSTGPHLHYEIRKQGLIVDPSRSVSE